MAYDLVIQDAEGLVHVTLAGTVLVGQPIAYNGSSGWVAADASMATTPLYAQYIAGQSGVSGDVITAYRRCTLEDLDAPWTANSIVYLSATAGSVTHTRPTEAAAFIQVLGRAIDTSHLRLDIQAPREVEVFIQPDTFDTTAEAGLGVTDSPAWVGPSIDSNATAEDVHFTGRIPANAVSLSLARVVCNSVGSTTGTIGWTIICAADGATNTGDTGTGITAATPTGIADNKLCYFDITAAFDADAFKPGYNFTVMGEAGGTFANDIQVIGLLMRYICV